MIISLRQISLSLLLVLLVIYIFFGYIFENWIGYSFLIGTLLIFVSRNFVRLRINRNNVCTIVLYLFFSLYLFLTSIWAYNIHTTSSTAILTSTLFMLAIFSQSDENFYSRYFLLLLIPAVFHAFITLLPFISPTLYLQVLRILPSQIQTEALEFFKNGASPGFTNQTSINGFYISLGLAICFIQVLLANKKKMYFFLLPFFIIALLLSGKRGFLVASAISTLLILFLLKKVSLKAIAIIGLILLMIWFSIMYMIDLYPETEIVFSRFIFDHNESVRDLSSGRTELYKIAIELFLANPIQGIGYGCFAWFADKGTHNVYLQLLCETGIVGFLLFILILLVNFFESLKTIKFANGERRKYLLYSIYFQLFFMIYSMSGNPLTDSFIFINYLFVCNIYILIRNKNAIYIS